MILALTTYMHGAGGAQRQMSLLANAMACRGHEVHLIVLSDFNKKYAISENVIIHDLTIEEKKSFHPIIGRFKALKKTYKKISPDVTIHFNIQSSYLTICMPRRYYKKAIYSERSDPYDKEYSGLLRIVRYFTLKRIDGFVFQSEGARDYFDESIQLRSTIIHNSVSVPLGQYEIPKKRDNRIVSVGRLHEQKNHVLLIKAFCKIANLFPDIKLEIYGDGHLRGLLCDLIQKCGLEGRVILLSSRKDIFDCIVTAKLFVLSSDYEGLPNALLEAMALGLPCISTDCRPGGARTLINDGYNGYIVPRRDIDALAKKMKYLLDNPKIAERIAKNAIEITTSHSEMVIFNKWEMFINKIYNNLL